MKMPLVSSQSPLLDIVAIESSALANVAYNNERATFRVEFRDGTVYQYLGVQALTSTITFEAASPTRSSVPP
jgi:hypothetical protein